MSSGRTSGHKQRNSSPHTIAACKDTWNLMLRYLSVEKGIGMAGISMDDITAAAVTDFLDYMTEKKGWLPSTRNHRLSCIRSFFNETDINPPAELGRLADASGDKRSTRI